MKSFATPLLRAISPKRRLVREDRVDRERIANSRNRRRTRLSNISECGRSDILGELKSPADSPDDCTDCDVSVFFTEPTLFRKTPSVCSFSDSN